MTSCPAQLNFSSHLYRPTSYLLLPRRGVMTLFGIRYNLDKTSSHSFMSS